jgi:tRNA pseudouridine55 synthase
MLGIALVDKPLGLSSHDAIYGARRALGIKKIGHAGTLDPNATGLLVMAIGEATRFLPYLALEPKVYEGVARLGAATSTQDSEGEVISEAPADHVTLKDVVEAAERFTGNIEQVPPMFSAVQVGGQRLYKIARAGGEVERKARSTHVESFEIESLSDSSFAFRVVCAGGTYVRTLAHDLGESLGVGAHLTALRRTDIGTFSINDSVPPDELTPDRLMPLDVALPHIPAVRLPEAATAMAKHGGEFTFAGDLKGGYLLLLDDAGVYAIAVRIDGNTWRPERVVPDA